ncbi:MAG: AmmeMemoRadiSam system protein A [Ignavibacteria bacterium]|nr:AmmeMemoRadiSam system protein A [Ignavibacteria bacterium]
MNKYFSDSDKLLMVNLAKDSVEMFVRRGERASLEDVPQSFKKKLACFVTLNDKKDLRGCIGTIEPYGTLYESIVDNAIAAASRDHRFPPVTSDELQNLSYEVSVLSKPELYEPKSLEDLLLNIKNKGLIIRKDFRSAVYLPQVWEHFSDSRDFLSSLCRKAGFTGNEWADYRNMKFFVFSLLE